MLMVLALFFTSVLGLAALALAMDRHHGALACRWRGRFARRLLRLIGVGLIAGALLCAVIDVGWAQGVILWFGVLTPSALGVIGLLAGIDGFGARGC